MYGSVSIVSDHIPSSALFLIYSSLVQQSSTIKCWKEELYTVFSCFRHIFLAAKIKLNIFGVVWEGVFWVLSWKKTRKRFSCCRFTRGGYGGTQHSWKIDGRGSNVQCADVYWSYPEKWLSKWLKWLLWASFAMADEKVSTVAFACVLIMGYSSLKFV